MKKNSHKKPASRLLSKKPKKGQVSVYIPISHHIYHDGHSYRVRAQADGVRHTQNFPTIRKAYIFRKAILNAV